MMQVEHYKCQTKKFVKHNIAGITFNLVLFRNNNNNNNNRNFVAQKRKLQTKLKKISVTTTTKYKSLHTLQ